MGPHEHDLSTPHETTDPPIAIVICGCAGSGKSTLARLLARSLANTLILDKDTINEALLATHRASDLDHAPYRLAGPEHSRTSAHYLEHVRYQSYRCLLDLACDNLRLGKSPILDGNYHKEVGNGYLTQELMPTLEKLGARTCVILCVAHESILRQRLVTRGLTRDHARIACDQVWQEFLQANPITPPNMDSIRHLQLDTGNGVAAVFDLALEFVQRARCHTQAKPQGGRP